MTIRNRLTATALAAALAAFGGAFEAPAFADDSDFQRYVYDVETGVTTWFEDRERGFDADAEAQGTPLDEASLPDHVAEALEIH